MYLVHFMRQIATKKYCVEILTGLGRIGVYEGEAGFGCLQNKTINKHEIWVSDHQGGARGV